MTAVLKAIASAAAFACAGVLAQGAPSPTPNVTLYGAIDAALVYVNDINGKSRRTIDTAGNWASRWGLRGREDLGGGTAAIFTLESGFNTDDGSLGQGGLIFGRQAFVGLSNTTYGTLTLGRQYDFIYAIPPDIVMVIGGLAGSVGGGGAPADMHLGGTRYNSSIKWVGDYGPVRVGAMYGLGRENGDDKMGSAMLGYRAGPVNAGIAYTRDNFSPVAPFVAGNDVLVATAHYDITPNYKLIGLAGRSKAHLAANSTSSNKLAEIGLIYKATAELSLGAVYGDAKLRNAVDAAGDVKVYGVGAYYDFSRRTTVYGIATSVHSSGSAGKAYSSIPGIGGSPATFSASGNSQAVFKLGIRHFF